MPASQTPRVFISYTRSDGAEFARTLRKRLEQEGIPLWQDRVGLEGGRDWWLQITEALDQVEFMVLVMTPNAMRSETVRKEWRYARKRGVCVYPVQGTTNLDFASLPRWMRDAHFYEVDQEWTKFVNDLNTGCRTPRVPFMVEDLPEDFVPRPNEFDALVTQLLDSQHGEPIAITAALRGAGGYGKTTLARALCHDERIQEAFDDGVLWVTLGENPGDLTGRVADLIEALSGERPGFEGIDAARARLVELLADRDMLIVIDDVWNGAHLRPFTNGGPRCARLITTRNLDTLPGNAKTVDVDAMREDEAVKSVSAGLPSGNEKDLRKLVVRLGAWPLLLKLAHGVLRDRIKAHQPLPEALAYVNHALDKRGLTAFDARDAEARDQAVSKTLGVTLDLLTESDRDRYAELAVFPEDANIPLATVGRLWGKTATFDELDTEELCSRLHGLSLLLRLDLRERYIRLHDVMLKYLVHQCGRKLPFLHNQLLDAHRPSSQEWADLPSEEPYLWDHLANHLTAAGRSEELVATAKDLRYLAGKAWARSAPAVEGDLIAAESAAHDDAVLRTLRRSFVQSCHILCRAETLPDLQATLHSRLEHVGDLAPLTGILAKALSPPYLTTWHRLPDLPHPALVRTLTGHTDGVTGCAVSPDGAFLVSVSHDRTLKVWDPHSGAERLTLAGHTGRVTGCAVSPDGAFIVSASADQTLKVWDARSGAERFTLSGHTDAVMGCAVSPDGAFIVSASNDQTLKIWDARIGVERLTLAGHTDGVTGCAVTLDGALLVSASWDQTLKVWDARSGAERFTLAGHATGVTGCAVTPDGAVIVSASEDQTLKVWDARKGVERFTLAGHTDVVRGCAASPDGAFIVSASEDQTLRVWDARSGVERSTIAGHTDTVTGCAVSPDGAFIISASWDKTLKIWEARSGVERFTLAGHTQRVSGCAVSPDGAFLVSASWDRTLKVWDARRGAERFTLAGHTDAVRGCVVSGDGTFIVSFSQDGTLKIWDARSGTERYTLAGHTDAVTRCAVSLDGAFIVSASEDGILKIWDAHSGTERYTLAGHTAAVTGCAVSPDGGFIVSASEDETLKIWDAHSGTERFTLAGHTAAVTRCAMSPDGAFIVSASWDGTLKIWDPHSGAERLTLVGHTEVSGCVVSPDGAFIVSASSKDQTLKVWDAQIGDCLTTLSVDAPLTACAWFPDGEHVAAVGEGGVYFLRFVR